MNAPDKPFYLGVNRRAKPENENPWFICAPMGKNTLGDLAKKMSEKAGLSGRFTNHSGRKTAVTKLVNENVPVNQIMQLTGHRNVKSINDYSTASLKKQQEMSTILSKITKPQPGLDSTLQSIENYETAATVTGLIENVDNVEFQPVPADNQDSLAGNIVEPYVPEPDNNTVSLPLTSSPGGSLSVQLARNHFNKFNPQSMFHGCTFNAPVHISMNPN